MVLSDFTNIAVGGNDLASIYLGGDKIWEKNTDAAANIKYVATTAPRWQLYSDGERVEYSFEATTTVVNFTTVTDFSKAYELKVTGDTLTEITAINGLKKFDYIGINAPQLTVLNLNGITISDADGAISGGNSLKITLSDTDSATKGYLTTILGNSGYSYTWDGDSILNCTK